MIYPEYLITPNGDGSYTAKPITAKAPAEQFSKRDTSPVPVSYKKVVTVQTDKIPDTPEALRAVTWEMLKKRAKEINAEKESEKESEDSDFIDL